MGPDTVMSIVYAFNALYPVRGEPGYNELEDHTLGIRPLYIGKGPETQTVRQFFIDQARAYSTNRQEIAKIIAEVYRYGNRYTPKP